MFKMPKLFKKTKAKVTKPTGWKHDVRTIAEGLLIAVVIRSFIIQPFNIPSGSMYPTLVVGDYVFVTKFSYGYSRYSLPFGGYWLPDFDRVAEKSPEQGDVSVFRVIKEDLDFIKRVIGLPGDKIQMKRGRLYINKRIVKRTRIEDSVIGGKTVPTYIETLPNGVSHKIWEVSGDTNSFSDDTQEYTVPEGHYFMMGDNRDSSDDSRFGRVGFVPLVAFVGKAQFIGWSLGTSSTWQVWNWYEQGKLDRLGKAID